MRKLTMEGNKVKVEDTDIGLSWTGTISETVEAVLVIHKYIGLLEWSEKLGIGRFKARRYIDRVPGVFWDNLHQQWMVPVNAKQPPRRPKSATKQDYSKTHLKLKEKTSKNPYKGRKK